MANVFYEKIIINADDDAEREGVVGKMLDVYINYDCRSTATTTTTTTSATISIVNFYQRRRRR